MFILHIPLSDPPLPYTVHQLFFPASCSRCTSTIMSLELGIQLTSWYRVISITLVLILYAPTLTVSQICYDLDGNVLPTYGICTPTDVASVCCGINDACLTHGLCSSINGNYYRGGCTDQTFNSKACSSICVGGESDRNLLIGFHIETHYLQVQQHPS